jgi:hypothetical protein
MTAQDPTNAVTTTAKAIVTFRRMRLVTKMRISADLGNHREP